MRKIASLRVITLKYAVLLGLMLSMIAIGSCDLKDKLDDLNDTAQNATQSAENVLRDALDALDRNSSNWQQVIRDAQSKLTEDAQSTIRNELNDILQRGIAAVGGEFRCNTDFVANRVRGAVQRLLAKITAQPIPPLEPGLCNVVPLAIDRSLVPQRLNNIAFYGYDFDRTDIRARLINSNGQRDVSASLSKPTHYHMVLNLGGNGVPLTDKSQKVKIFYANTLLSELPVIQPATPVCKTKVITVPGSTITYMPPHTRGDREFDGHGPKVSSSIRLEKKTDGSAVTVRLSMRAVETKSDWSTAEGSKVLTFYTAPSGWKVDSIEGETQFVHSYIDGDHTDDVFNFGAGSLVNRITYRGDHKGKDAGVYTQMEAHFNPVRLQLVETANCVSPKALKTLKKEKLISPQLLRSLEFRLPPATLIPPHQ